MLHVPLRTDNYTRGVRGTILRAFTADVMLDQTALFTLDRGGQRYGPYSLEQLREYVAQGSVLPSDLVWRSGMYTWVPVQHILADAAAASQPAGIQRQGLSNFSAPPALHWGFVLLFGVLTLSLFYVVWCCVQARWVRQIDRRSPTPIILGIGIPLSFALAMLGAFLGNLFLTGLYYLVEFAMWQIAYFSMRGSIVSALNVRLNGALTFFFNIFYLQHHLTKIARSLPNKDPQPDGLVLSNAALAWIIVGFVFVTGTIVLAVAIPQLMRAAGR